MAGFSQKNIEKTQRNGKAPESKTVIKYITVMGTNGADGLDSYNVVLSPNNLTFTAGALNAENQTHYVEVYAYRGSVQIDALVLDSSIEGRIPDASDGYILDVSVEAGTNGTNHTRLIINVTDGLSADSGQIRIPVQYNCNATDSSTAYDASMWDPENNALAQFDAIFSWTLGKTGQSTYVLDLSNETATINCDASGNVLAGAVRPPCKATLSFGADSSLNGVYYDISTGDASVRGLTINHTTGDLIYDANNTLFNFGDLENTILNVQFDASYDGRVRGRKVMTIEKALPGQQGPAGYTPYIGANGNWWINGEDTGVKAEGEDGSTGADAVSRWIDLSASQVKIDASNNIIPSTITATAWKQVGGNTPTTDPSCNIKWFPDSSTERAYSSAVTVNAAWNMITFKLYFGTVYIGETETVPILKDGVAGAQGPRGAAIRGPVLWDSSSNVNVTGLSKRWFYCGVQTDNNKPEEADFIDVILHDGQYYMCNNNYEQAANATWNSVKSNWTVADASYNFVAANVILAKNAGIDFLTGNEIYLRDPSGNITAGAAGGNGISFWAGAHYPSNAPFKVNYDGTMTATKGTFGCLEIGTDSSTGRSILQGTVNAGENYTDSVQVAPDYLVLDASTTNVSTTVTISPNTAIRDTNGAIQIDHYYYDPSAEANLSDSSLELYYKNMHLSYNALYTNENIHAGYLTQDTYNITQWHRTRGAGAVATPGLRGLEIVFVTDNDSSANFKKDTLTGTWFYAGMDTGVRYANLPYLARVDGTFRKYITSSSYRNYDMDDPEWGHWVFYYNKNYDSFVESGVISETSHRYPNTIYITI